MDLTHRIELTDLPLDVLALIFQNVSALPAALHIKSHQVQVPRIDLKSLCEVSKHLYKVATPYLYKKVVIRCEEGLNSRTLDCEAFSRRPGGFECSFGLAHVKELAITPRSRDISGGCCYHLHPLDPPTESDSEGSDFFYSQEGDFDEESFLRLCEQLQDNTLVAFRYGNLGHSRRSETHSDSWDLATCVPDNILGPRGYLPEHQRSLESLALITDFSCERRGDGTNEFDLSTFITLRTLSWIGLRSGDDFDTLVECLENNATHLRNLTLDLIDWEETELGMFDEDELDDEINLFADRVTTPRLRFPALERLSLSEVSFRTAAGTFASTFNFSQLKALRLWNCPGTVELLRNLTDLHRELPLVSLELVVDIRHADEPIERAVSRVLQTFSDLRDLFLSLYVWDWAPIIDVIMNGLRSLKRLVLHGRGVDADRESEWFEEGADRCLEWNDQLSLLFVSAECDVIGIANPPSFMVSLVHVCR